MIRKRSTPSVMRREWLSASSNDGGPEKQRAMASIQKECATHGWHIFSKQMYHSRGYPKLMRGDYQYSGDASLFWTFAKEFFDHIGL